jgi:hypothetical protein
MHIPTVYMDFPPFFHKFRLLIVLVGELNLSWYQSRGLRFKSAFAI